MRYVALLFRNGHETSRIWFETKEQAKEWEQKIDIDAMLYRLLIDDEEKVVYKLDNNWEKRLQK